MQTKVNRPSAELNETQTKGVPQIVVVGGGAGGLELVTKLGRKLAKKNRANVTLIDRHRVHIWKPLLHEVATGSLDTEIDGVVYRAHAKRHGYRFQLGTVTKLDRQKKVITLAPIEDDEGGLVVPERTIAYDTLVLAIGSISNDFGTPGVKQFCSLLDSKAQAQRFQQKLLNQFLKTSAQSENDQQETRLAIVGGGATGVELSAELHHLEEVAGIYAKGTNEAPRFSIDLIEAGPRILPALPERIAIAATNELEKLGVRVHTNIKIIGAQSNGFIGDDNKLIEADLMVWAAGVKVESWLREVGLEVNKINQVVSHRTLKSISDENIFVVGDCADVEMPDGTKVPPRAQSAHQMADVVATNIVREFNGQPPLEFTYKDHGSLVNLSRFSTVGSLMGNLVKGSMFIEGKVARLMYLSLYRMHQLAIHGIFKGPFIILLSRVSKIIRPKIKLH
ncbi:MAG: NAD(P)/FAD-dependent oxidoreductase [Gammaproteobacteria bacterium]|nr:NAD(P)/FAD-dependent oxidoreductase [Gammaproteobacteria bacterium]